MYLLFCLPKKVAKNGHWGFPRGTPQRVSHCVQNIAPNHTGQVRGTGRRRNCRTPYRRHDFAKQITAKRSRAAKFRELAYGSNNSNFACSYPKHPDGAAVAPSRGGFVGATFCVRAGHCFGAILYSTPPAALPLSPSPRGTPAPEKIFFQKTQFCCVFVRLLPLILRIGRGLIRKAEIHNKRLSRRTTPPPCCASHLPLHR